MNSRAIMDQAMERVRVRASLISKVVSCLLKCKSPPWTVVHIIQSFAFRSPLRFPEPVFQLHLTTQQNLKMLEGRESGTKLLCSQDNQYIKMQKGKLYLVENTNQGSHTVIRMETTWPGVIMNAQTLKQRAISNFFSFLESRHNRIIIGDAQDIHDIQTISSFDSLAKLRAIQQENSTVLKVMQKPMIWMRIDNLSVLYVDSVNCGMTHFRMVYHTGSGWLIKNNQTLTVWIKLEGSSRRPKIVKYKQQKVSAEPRQEGPKGEQKYTKHVLQDWRIDQVRERVQIR